MSRPWPVPFLARWPWRSALLAAARLCLVSLLLGWLYTWAGPKLYPPETRFGFGWGMAHGACMPMALPALLLGKDVDIYSAHNLGRGYKLGYIVGINLCGLVFFGGAFWRPRSTLPAPGEAVQNHQLR